MIKQQKYQTPKYASDRSKTKMTTLRFDKITEENLKDLQSNSGLSQSQIIRQLINGEHVIQKDVRTELFTFRDKLNHLAKIYTNPKDKHLIQNLEREYSELKSKVMGGV